MTEKNLIYALYNPYNNEPVYVGKTTQGLDRPFEHIKEKSHNDKVNEWVKELRRDGKEPILVILETYCPDELLSDKENFWIQRYIKQGYILLNIQGVSPKYISNSFLFESKNNDDDYLHDIRTFIIFKRKQLKLTQADLAMKAGVGIRIIRELEQFNSIKNNFNTASIQSILNLFGAKMTIK